MTPLPRRRPLLLALALALCPAALCQAQDDAPQTGTFNTTFHERSPLSDHDAMARVAGWQHLDNLPDWDIETIEFQMVVPDDYTGDEAYGLLVFIHPNDDVNATNPNAFFFGRVIQDVLAEHKLIWVSFDEAGNPVMPNKRMGLALDAVHNVTQQYNIDPQRVYVSGMSGGGRMTCMTGLYYPQVFTGAVPIVGSLYFRAVPVPEDPALRRLLREQPGDNAVWGPSLVPPSRAALRDMQAAQRWVLLAGEADFNMPEMRSHFEHGFEHDGFEHAHYLEVPGMAHTYPDADWFEQAIVLLDAPLNQTNPADDEDEDPDNANDTPQQRHDEQQARRRLQAAQRMAQPDPDRALRMLRRVVELYPDTRAAQRAGELIAELEAEPDANDE